MPQKPTIDQKIADHQEVLAAHMAATTAAFQVLVHCLQETGALDQGQVAEALLVYMEMVKSRHGNEIELALLNDLREALFN